MTGLTKSIELIMFYGGIISGIALLIGSFISGFSAFLSLCGFAGTAGSLLLKHQNEHDIK